MEDIPEWPKSQTNQHDANIALFSTPKGIKAWKTVEITKIIGKILGVGGSGIVLLLKLLGIL